MTLHWVSLPVVGNYCGLALGHIDVLIDYAGEPRRLSLQVPVNDAEHRLRLLLLHYDILDMNDILDKENPPVCQYGQASVIWSTGCCYTRMWH